MGFEAAFTGMKTLSYEAMACYSSMYDSTNLCDCIFPSSIKHKVVYPYSYRLSNPVAIHIKSVWPVSSNPSCS